MAVARKARKHTSPKPLQTEPGSPLLKRAENWLATHRKAVLWILLGASVLLRAVYFAELRQGPCLAAHRWTESDMNFFDRSARAIAGGDWLLNQELHPMFRWQVTVAQAHFDCIRTRSRPTSAPEFRERIRTHCTRRCGITGCTARNTTRSRFTPTWSRPLM
jgi:hypothetical protein